MIARPVTAPITLILSSLRPLFTHIPPPDPNHRYNKVRGEVCAPPTVTRCIFSYQSPVATMVRKGQPAALPDQQPSHPPPVGTAHAGKVSQGPF